jgi:hypothetical protein
MDQAGKERGAADAVDLPDAPTAAVGGEDAVAVQVANDALDAHLALGAKQNGA